MPLRTQLTGISTSSMLPLASLVLVPQSAMRTESASSASLTSDHFNVVAVGLLDECWFFKNALVLRKENKGIDQADAPCPNRAKDGSSLATLQRMPTLPPRLRRMDAVQEEAITPLTSCNPKLRHSLSSLDNYQSTPSSKSVARDKSPRYIKHERSERYLAIQHYVAKEAYYRKIFKEKKWRSHSDLEYIEVQGFEDLGFVFDKSVSDKKTNNGEKIMWPCLPEAWRAQKSDHVMFGRVDKRSAEDMKEHLKFWARAVARNARQEF